MYTKLIFIALLVTASVFAWVSFGSSNAEFSHTTAESISISIRPWQQADDLLISVTDACLNPPGKRLSGIHLANTGTRAITIDSLRFSWTPNDSSEHIRLVQFMIAEGVQWTGSEPSGTTLQLRDGLVIDPGESDSGFMLFDSDMSRKEMIITAFMSDRSLKTVSFILPEGSPGCGGEQ
jgi:hypothetical protein